MVNWVTWMNLLKWVNNGELDDLDEFAEMGQTFGNEQTKLKFWYKGLHYLLSYIAVIIIVVQWPIMFARLMWVAADLMDP